MFEAFAPRMPRGCSWALLAISTIALGVAPTSTRAQAPAPKAAAKPEVREDEVPAAEVFVDPNAKKALTIMSPLSGPQVRPAEISRDLSNIQNMASGSVAVDSKFLSRYVEYYAVELSKRDNLNAIINPPPNLKPEAARGLEKAVDALTDPMMRGRANNNAEFLTAYNKALFDSSLVKLLENNLLARIDAMIVLGMSGSTASNALNLYIDQLKKADQVVWVKLWAARGLSNAAQEGRVNLDATKTIQGAEALIAFLDSDPKLPWPAQMRALEALGSLRLAYNTTRGKVDAASKAMRFLADPEARPEVRAWAAWALGMMKVPSSLTGYNFDLTGHAFGDLAADLGRRIVQEYDDNASAFDKGKDRAFTLTSLLLFQVVPGLSGQEGVTESGLLRSTSPGLNASRPFLSKLDDKVKAVTRDAYELIRAGGTAQKARRDDLDGKLADLKSFLAQSSPKDRHLVPGGPEFAPIVEKVAGAARR